MGAPKPAEQPLWEWVDLPQGGWETLFVIYPSWISATDVITLNADIKARLSESAPRLVPLPSGAKLLFKREPAPAPTEGKKE